MELPPKRSVQRVPGHTVKGQEAEHVCWLSPGLGTGHWVAKAANRIFDLGISSAGNTTSSDQLQTSCTLRF